MERSDEIEASAKRRRISLACNECRERKRKCDGVKPICGNCSRRTDRTCEWDDERANRGWTNSYVEGLKDRVAALEGELHEVKTRQSGTASSLSPHVSTSVPGSADRARSHDHTREQDPYDNSDAFEAGLDGMGLLSGGVSGNEHRSAGQKQFYGPSSAASLLDRARHAMAQKAAGYEESPSNTLNVWRASSSDTPQLKQARDRGSHTVDLVYPSRSRADRLVESYWHSAHSLYPFIHRPSFEARYATIWDPQYTISSQLEFYTTLDERAFYCLVNTVFAMGALFSPGLTLNERNTVSRTFFERANNVLDFELVARGSVPLVQMLLLLGQYLQTTDKSSFCWNIIGTAIRVAQGIGLHHEPRCCRQGRCERAEHSQLEIEMRRRTWTGCVLLDRILGLMFGRPLMVPPTCVRMVLPSAIDDEYISSSTASNGQQPEGIENKVDCYIHAIKLQNIMAELLITLNAESCLQANESSSRANLSSSTADGKSAAVHIPDLQSLLAVENSLEAWHNALPAHLRAATYSGAAMPEVGQADSRDVLFRRQANVLEGRYLLIRMTMLRPALCALSDLMRMEPRSSEQESSSSSMQIAMLRQAANTCVTVAHEQLSHIVRNTDSPVDILSAPWYNVLYVHGAAMVFLLGHLCGLDAITSLDRPAMMGVYDKCLEYLRRMEPYNRSARRCLKVLELVRQEIVSHRKPSEVRVNGQGPSSTCRTTGNAGVSCAMFIPGMDNAQPLGNDTMQTAGLSSSQYNPQGAVWQDDTVDSYLFPNDQSNFWMGDSLDMTSLSFMPFWENTEHTWPSYQ